MSETQAKCIQCEKGSQEVPLLQMEFNGQTLWICPQHLPILIHKPAQLAEKLPGASFSEPSEGHHH